MDHRSPSIVVVVFFLSILGPLILKYTPTMQTTTNDRQPDTNCCSYSVHQAQFLEGNSERWFPSLLALLIKHIKTELRKTKAKLTRTANQSKVKDHRESIRYQSINKQTVRGVGKCKEPSSSWFKFWIWLAERMGQFFWTDHMAQ